MPTDAAYPRTLTVMDRVVTLRPMLADDRQALLDFARALPSNDLLFLSGDITDPRQVDLWLRDMGHADNVTILALSGGLIVGFSTVVRAAAGWTRHVGELRIVVAPDLRGHGLGRLLAAEAFRTAIAMGVQKMFAQMTADQDHAIHAFQRLGFRREALLHDQVKDRDNLPHDLVIMSRRASDEDDIPAAPAA